MRQKDVAPFPLSQLLFGNQLQRRGPWVRALLPGQEWVVGSVLTQLQ